MSSPLAPLVLLSTIAFIGTGGAVGARLLLVAHRSRSFTDFTVGFGLFVLAGVAYPLVLASRALVEARSEAARPVLAVAFMLLALGWSAVFLFTWRVFRPAAGWARHLAQLGIAGLVAAGVAAGLEVFQALAVADLSLGNRPALVLQALALGVYAWSGLESLLHYGSARRRLALGLADPLVVDRFRLWAWTCLSAAISVAPSLVVELAGGRSMQLPWVQLTTCVSGFVCSVVLWLAFLPPERYRARVLARHATRG